MLRRSARCLLHIADTWKGTDGEHETKFAEAIIEGLLENGRLTAEQVSSLITSHAIVQGTLFTTSICRFTAVLLGSWAVESMSLPKLPRASCVN